MSMYQGPGQPSATPKKKKGGFLGDFDTSDPLNLALLLAPLAELMKHGAGSHLYDTAVKGKIATGEQQQQDAQRQSDLAFRTEQISRQDAQHASEQTFRQGQADISHAGQNEQMLSQEIERRRRLGLPIPPEMLQQHEAAYQTALQKRGGAVVGSGELYPRRDVTTPGQLGAPEPGYRSTTLTPGTTERQAYLPQTPEPRLLAEVDPETFGPGKPGEEMGHLPVPMRNGKEDVTAVSLIRSRVLRSAPKPAAPAKAAPVGNPTIPVTINGQTYNISPGQAAGIAERAQPKPAKGTTTRPASSAPTPQERTDIQRGKQIQTTYDKAEADWKAANQAFYTLKEQDRPDPRALQNAQVKRDSAFARYLQAKNARDNYKPGIRTQPISTTPPASTNPQSDPLKIR